MWGRGCATVLTTVISPQVLVWQLMKLKNRIEARDQTCGMVWVCMSHDDHIDIIDTKACIKEVLQEVEAWIHYYPKPSRFTVNRHQEKVTSASASDGCLSQARGIGIPSTQDQYLKAAASVSLVMAWVTEQHLKLLPVESQLLRDLPVAQAAPVIPKQLCFLLIRDATMGFLFEPELLELGIRLLCVPIPSRTAACCFPPIRYNPELDLPELIIGRLDAQARERRFFDRSRTHNVPILLPLVS